MPVQDVTSPGSGEPVEATGHDDPGGSAEVWAEVLHSRGYLTLFKAVAYAVCLGTFRGGPVFPAIFLGAATGVLAADLLPGLGLVPALAIGMGAGMAVTGLPVTSVVLVAMLLGDAATGPLPVVILAVVVALVVEERLSSSRRLSVLVRSGTPEGATT